MTALIGIFICLILLAFYYGVIICGLRFCAVDFIKIFRKEAREIFFVAAISLLFIFLEVSLQRTIYIWDWLETWEPTVFCSERIFTEPYALLSHLKNSINHSDYNNFLPMLMALPMHIFSKSFLAYNFYVWIMFALPALFISAAALKTFLDKNFKISTSCAKILGVIAIIPAVEMPILNGYANVSILLTGITIFLMLLNLNRAELQKKRLLIISLLAIFTVIQSRSAAYMLFGLFSGYTAYILCDSKDFRAELKMLSKKFLFIGITAAALMAIMFFPFLKHALTYDFATAYSAYTLGHGFPIRILAHIYSIGFVPYAIFFVAIILGITKKFLRRYLIFSLVWIIISVMLICRIQFMSNQHQYIMLIPLCLVLAGFIVVSLKKYKTLGAILIALLLINFGQAYSKILPLNINGVFLPPVRNDIEELKIFVKELNELSKMDNGKIYFVASSGSYNGAILRTIYAPDNFFAVPNLLQNSDVDLRDGFPIHFFDADIVVVADPIQTHLRPEDQSVVVAVAQAFMNPTVFSKHFTLVKEYPLPQNPNDNAVTLKVYKKISQYKKSDIDIAEKYFDRLYPNQPALFHDRFEKYKANTFGNDNT